MVVAKHFFFFRIKLFYSEQGLWSHMQSAFSLQLSPAQSSGELRFTDKDFCMHCHLETEKERPEREQKPESECAPNLNKLPLFSQALSLLSSL